MDLSTSLNFLIPCLFALILGQLIVRLTSPNSTWARSIIVTVSFILTLRYIYWRSFYTLNLTTTTTTIISVFILVLEIFAWIMPYLNLFMCIKRKSRHKEADYWETSVKAGEYLPAVDVLIPTYNESVLILRRTIIGCQAIDYPHKQVYLLDDSERPEVEQLATELGCEYIARTEHSHAKAGNLNHALKITKSELIAIFDADFVPSHDFLTRTVGFFQKTKLALLQTHQHFYNQDAVARNLGLGNILGHPVEEFSARLNQPMRDYHNSVMCFGSSFVVRRSALESVGGFFTESITEDYFTGIKLLAHKYQVNYLNERLSAGLVPENISALFSQRMRWATGTIQGFFVSANPLTIKGLSLVQRLIYTAGIIHWFTNITLATFIFTIPLFFMLRMPPFMMEFNDWLAFFMPFLIFETTVFFWLGDRSASKIVIDIYSFLICFPITIAIVRTLIKPFARTFQVTQKGIVNYRSVFRWQLGLPIIYAWIITIFGVGLFLNLFINLEAREELIANINLIYSSLEIGFFWTGYYLIILTVCLFALIDKSQTDYYPWLKIQTKIQLVIDGVVINTVSNYLSETGVKLSFADDYSLPMINENQLIQVGIEELNLELTTTIKQIDRHQNKISLQLEYSSLELREYRQIIEYLFCQPHRWVTTKVPTEFASFKILLKSIIVRSKQIILRRKDNKITSTNLNLKSSSIEV